jgi:hypothetical protein
VHSALAATFPKQLSSLLLLLLRKMWAVSVCECRHSPSAMSASGHGMQASLLLLVSMHTGLHLRRRQHHSSPAALRSFCCFMRAAFGLISAILQQEMVRGPHCCCCCFLSGFHSGIGMGGRFSRPAFRSFCCWMMAGSVCGCTCSPSAMSA